MSVRESFVETFGEEQATRIEAAAEGHKNGIHDETGSDPFRWAITICIGFECITRPAFREEHGISVPVEQLEEWIREHGDLANHDGDCDFITLFAGGYDKYIKQPAEGAAA